MRLVDRARRFLVALMAVAATAATAQATPRFNNVLPHGGQRGTEVDVVVHGDNFADVEEVLFYDPGMEVVALTQPADENAKGKQLQIKFRIKPDSPLGSHRMRLRSRTGLSDLFSFYVGPLPVIEEVEPNTEFAAPQAISNNVTVHGRVDSEDVDYYAIDCKAGERITAEVFGLRLAYASSGNYFDPYVAILNEDRFELAVSDDTPLVGNDAVVSVVAPADGRYFVQIRDASYLGDGRAYYLLSIGSYPRPLAAYPAGGKPGETLSVSLLGDVAGPLSQQVTLPPTPVENFALEVADPSGIAPSSLPFRLVNLDNVLEQEPNDAAAQATPGPGPAAFNGVLEKEGDVDYFKFTATKGQTYEIECYGRRLRSAIDPIMWICNAQGSRFTGNDDSRGPDSYFRFQIPEDGEYLIEVRDHLNNGGPANMYRVEVTPVVPRVVASTLDVRRYVQPKIVIPQGGGCGVVVNVSRQDFGGPINFTSLDLPAGVTMECPEGWRGGTDMPVVFYAAEDAPIAGRFTTVTVALNDPNQPNLAVSGPLKQDILQVRGPNNTNVLTEEQLRLAIVVAEKAPFKVWIEAPKVPLVQNGSMNLKVKCERVEGFTAPINVSLLQNPPGCNSSGSVQIPEGQTEALIPMNAAGNAPPGTTMIAVKASSRTDEGRDATCTPFVPITVEEQYVTFEFAQAAVEQGKESPLLVTVKKRKDFEGEAQVTLLGLPANTTAEPLKLTKDQTELTFTVKADASAPVSDNKNLFCQVLVPEAGEAILHNLGTGRLRVDPPPPQPVAPAPTPEPMPMPVAEAAPAPRPLSRLEQLRQQQKEREAAQAAGTSGGQQ